jgi:hypothetical protein
MSIRFPVWVASISASACALIWLFRGIYLYWNDVRLLNFLAAWIPFVLSILLAFVPEHEMSTMKKILWRSSVIFIGFAWSVVLWHQQVVTDTATQQSQTTIVTEAVTKSNEHADSKFEQVEKDLENSKVDLGSRIDKVPVLLTKTESDLDVSISKVGTAPIKYAQLQFSIFDPNFGEPKTSQYITPDADGVYTVDFIVTNISDTAANMGDIWVHICTQCTYVVEPKGFDRPQGLDEHSRHRMFQVLNPGVSLEEMTVKFKIRGGPFTYTDVSFTWSCSSCGKMPSPQSIRNYLLPAPAPATN